MKIKLSEETYFTVTPMMIHRILFAVLSIAALAVICHRAVPKGRHAVAALDAELQSIYFQPDTVAVYVGDPLEVQPLTVPKNVKVSYIWELRDNGVLGVEQGSIVARRAGETMLGVSSGGIQAQIKVIVKHKPLPEDSTLPPLYYDTLMIANYKNTLASDYVPANMIRVPAQYVADNYAVQYLTQETWDAYLRLLTDMKAEVSGCRMHIISTYRSYARQTELYNAAVKRYMAEGNTSTKARLLALETTQTPGNSEHQLGNTIDVSNATDTDHDYQETPEGAWLAANAHKYGFIIRYPADKEELTRIAYEPWHIRYVGMYHANYMYVNNLCLEEYVDLQEKAQQEADYYAESHPAQVE